MLSFSFPSITLFLICPFSRFSLSSFPAFFSIQKYKWPFNRIFHFHSVDLHYSVRKIQTLSFLRCIDDVGKKLTHISLFFFLSPVFSGVCATSTVLKPTSILFVLPMGNLMIMHVKSKRHHARNRRKLKSCLWVDVKVTLITKLISKNVFNFCSEKRKRKREAGLPSHLALLAFPLGCCNVCGAWCWCLFLICWARGMPAVPRRKFC